MALNPTLKDVAEVAGVSTMTVSRVLNGGRHVRPELQRKVNAAIVKLGYRRNENARSIRPGQLSRLVGVILTNISNPYYARVMNGIEDVIGHSGRRVLVGISHSDPVVEADLVRDIIGRHVEGLIVVPSSAEGSHLSPDRVGGIPVAIASRPLDGAAADTVTVDDINGARQGVLHVLEAGCRRIAFIGSGQAVSTSERRLKGFRLAHEEFGIPVVDSLIHRDAVDIEKAEAVVSQAMTLPDAPDAYFASNNTTAVGALRALMPLASEHPAPVVSFDNFDMADVIPYPTVVIDHDAQALGRIAAQMLLRRMDDPEAGPFISVTLPTTLKTDRLQIARSQRMPPL